MKLYNYIKNRPTAHQRKRMEGRQMATIPRWYTLAEAAQFMGVSKSFIRDLVRRSKISYNRISDKPFSPLVFAEHWLNEYLMKNATLVDQDQ